MRLWKRLKNLWRLGELEPSKIGVIRTERENNTFTEYKKLENPRPFATIIKLRPKDEVEQILKENAD